MNIVGTFLVVFLGRVGGTWRVAGQRNARWPEARLCLNMYTVHVQAHATFSLLLAKPQFFLCKF